MNKEEAAELKKWKDLKERWENSCVISDHLAEKRKEAIYYLTKAIIAIEGQDIELCNKFDQDM